MDKGKRVLFLGTTGVAKKDVLKRLAAYCSKQIYKECDYFDFDVDYLLKKVLNQASFLDADIHTQRREWSDAWDECFKNRIAPQMEAGKDIFLGLHGCYIRSQYGARCVLDPKRVLQFEPTLIVTLIGDVYDMWWRTESRAKGEARRGRPTIEHLLGGRRSEVLIADLLALECGKSTKSLVVAIGHPCETVAKCIFSANPQVVYLSFPISEPRRMEIDKNRSGIDDVSAFIAKAHQYQRTNPNLAFICPLAIDELPFSKAFETLQGGKDDKGDLKQASFDRDALRWNLTSFWPEEERMAAPPSRFCDFVIDQVQQAAGSILTDVAWRDFRLAEQANALAVFNPIFNGRDEPSGGVANEVSFATRFGIPIYIYQDPKHDPQKNCDKWLNGFGGGTMGQNPSAQGIMRKQSIEEVFASLNP